MWKVEIKELSKKERDFLFEIDKKGKEDKQIKTEGVIIS